MSVDLLTWPWQYVESPRAAIGSAAGGPVLLELTPCRFGGHRQCVLLIAHQSTHSQQRAHCSNHSPEAT